MPFPTECVFDLVADVERYPEFLPGWSQVLIQERGADTLLVDQVVALAGLRLNFTSRAVFHRPEWLRIKARRGAFRFLEIRWRFVPEGGAGCNVELEADVELRSRLLEKTAGGLVPLAFTDLLPRFEARARALGDPGGG